MRTTRRWRIDWASVSLYYALVGLGIVIGLAVAVKYGNAWPEWK